MNCIFIFLSCVLISLNLIFFNFNFIPVHDAKLMLDLFYFFYNEFFYYFHIAHWMSDNFYGMPATYLQLISMTPMSYVVGFVGIIFRVEDAFLLWKVSIVLEQFMFLWGLYLLSGLLFSRRTVIVFICLGGILSTLWWGQISFNFRLFYMIPLILFCFFTFFKYSRPEFLWLAGIAGLSALLGNPPYFSCLWFFCFFLIALVLSCWYSTAWKSLLSRKFSNYAATTTFIALFLMYIYFVSHVMDGQVIDTKGRDPITGRSDLETFLMYGGIPSLEMVRDGFLFIVKYAVTGHHPKLLLDMFYIGIMPLVFFIWSLLRVRDPFYYAILIVLVALVALSFGGFFARLVYYFPMMSYVRHIGCFYGFIKILLLLCAGFGLENFCRQKIGPLKLLIVAILLIAMASMKMGNFPWWTWSLIGIFLVAIICWFIFLRRNIVAPRFFLIIIVSIFALDLLWYQKIIFTNGPFTTSKDMALVETYKVHQEEYHPQRTLLSGGETLRQKQAIDLARYGHRFNSIYSHVQMDPCYPLYINQFRTASIDRLMRINPSLPAKVAGCYDSKLQLIVDVGSLSSLDVLSFNANVLNVLVDMRSAQGGWLFYADAYHPQWRALVDGNETPVRLAKGAYKAVFVEQGKHTVSFSFDRGTLALAGIAFALFGLFAGFAYCYLIVFNIISSSFEKKCADVCGEIN